MEILYLLIPLSVVLVFVIGGAFWWAICGGRVPCWTGPLSGGQRAALVKALALLENTGPAKCWLTEFEDHWPYGKAPGDVFFARAPQLDRLQRHASARGSVEPTLLLAVGVALVPPLLRRRKR